MRDSIFFKRLAVAFVLASYCQVPLPSADASWLRPTPEEKVAKEKKAADKKAQKRISKLQDFHTTIMSPNIVAAKAQKAATSLQTTTQAKESLAKQHAAALADPESDPELKVQLNRQLNEATLAQKSAKQEASHLTAKAMGSEAGHDMAENIVSLAPVGSVKGTGEVVAGYALNGQAGASEATFHMVAVAKGGAVTATKLAGAVFLGKAAVAGAAIAGVTGAATGVVAGAATGSYRGYKNTAAARRELDYNSQQEKYVKSRTNSVKNGKPAVDQATATAEWESGPGKELREKNQTLSNHEAKSREKNAGKELDKSIDEQIDHLRVGQKDIVSRVGHTVAHHAMAPVKAMGSAAKYLASKISEKSKSLYARIRNKSAQVPPLSEEKTGEKSEEEETPKEAPPIKLSSASAYDKRLKEQSTVVGELSAARTAARDAVNAAGAKTGKSRQNKKGQPEPSSTYPNQDVHTYQLATLMELRGNMNLTQTQRDKAIFEREKAQQDMQTYQGKSAAKQKTFLIKNPDFQKSNAETIARTTQTINDSQTQLDSLNEQYNLQKKVYYQTTVDDLNKNDPDFSGQIDDPSPAPPADPGASSPALPLLSDQTKKKLLQLRAAQQAD